MRPAYALGRGDYSAGRSMSDNRFKSGTEAYKEWESGWIDAVRADPLLNDDERDNLIGAN